MKSRDDIHEHDGKDVVMQVEVNEIDSQHFSLRIFCEKRPGVFVKLMQNLDVLGLDIVNANITTFRGLVLNILNAEVFFICSLGAPLGP